MAIIRRAQKEDLDGIEKITQEFDNGECSHPPHYFQEAINTKHMFVALENERIIGYLVYHILWGNTPFMELLKISTPFQRKGIGSQLLTTLNEQLVNDNYDSLVSSSEQINDVGNSFHKKQGFQIIGELSMKHGKEIFYIKKLS